MGTTLRVYLNSIRASLRLDHLSEREIVRELQTHLEERTGELRQAGFSEEKAVNEATQYFGSPKVIAREMYQVHSQGDWREALLAAMPHLLCSLLFALHLWQNTGWLTTILISTSGIAIYGWWHGKPGWLFPWLGYFLVPVLVAGLFLLSLPNMWAHLAILVYVPIALWLLFLITVQAVRRDWLYGSLMLLPIPTLAGWLLAVHPQDRFLGCNEQRLSEFGGWVALSFLALAITAATFIRLRQRPLKIGALLIVGISVLMLVALSSSSAFSLPVLLVLLLCSLALLISPALLEHKVGHEEAVDKGR